MTALQYLLVSTICISIFYAAYLLISRNERNFNQLRVFLLASIFLSLLLPLNNFKIDAGFSKGFNPGEPASDSRSIISATKSSTPQSEINYNSIDAKKVSSNAAQNWFRTLIAIYLIVTGLLVIRVVWHLIYLIAQYFKSEKTRDGDIVFIRKSKFKKTFAFFRWIFLNEDQNSSEDIDQILLHEKIHASQYHSFDLILIELLAAVMWFNPLVWMMRNSIQLVHEYLADEGALGTGIDKLKYQALLINQVTEERLICLSSSFNHSLIKKRIVMMTKSKFNHKAKLKIFALVPIAASLFIGVACINGQNKSNVVTAVEPVKMNVLYLGVDNPVRIATSGYKTTELSVSIDNGTILGEEGIYNVRPEKQGIATITVKSKDDIIQTSQFRVKVVPDPVAYIGDKKGGEIEKSILLNQNEVNAWMENFDFDLTFEIVEFTVSATIDGNVKEIISNSGKITEEQKNLIKQVKSGGTVYFQGVKCKGPDGLTRKLGAAVFKVV